MATQVRCPAGHLWGLDDFDTAADPLDPTTPVACPYCGELCTVVGDPSSPASRETLPASSPTVVAPAPEFPGYQIVGELGRGGMGVVYKARQIHTDRLVAIKVPDRTDLESAVRFATEAKAAARVQSPNIVQVFEVGQKGERSYLIMEFCPGGTLAERLDGTPLPFRPVAGLIEAVARAVGSAHAAGVVHRDLKPANILLCPHPGADPSAPFDPDRWVPKVTDFGLARRLDVDVGQTQSGMILGTPRYMSPEQATGDNRIVGPAADVYALGVILYELLTGRPPFWGTNALETLDQIRSDDPVSPARLRSHLPRDLETISLKCLHKDPARRYASATELADDLNRFLGGHPIQARPVSRIEHLVKRARRNPAVTALSGFLCLIVLGAIGYGVWYQFRLQAQRDRATAERDKAKFHLNVSMRAIEEMYTEVAEEDLAGTPRSEARRKRLLEKALAFYEELRQIEADDPELTWQAARAARRVADIYRLLDRLDEARTAYVGALDRLRPLAAGGPYRAPARREQAECHTGLGEIERERGDPARAGLSYEEALAIQLELHADDKDQAGYRKDLSQSRYNLGIVAKNTSRPADAVAEFKEALEWLVGLPADPKLRQHQARVHLNRGAAHRLAGQLPAADADCAEAVRLMDGLTSQYPDRPEYRYELAAALINYGNVRFTDKDLPEARRHIDRARDLLGRLVADYPLFAKYRVDLAQAFNTLAAIDYEVPDRKTATAHLTRAVELWETLANGPEDKADYHGKLGLALGNLGRSIRESSPADARRHLTRGLGELLVALRTNPNAPAYRTSFRQQMRDLAWLLVAASEHDVARRQATELAQAVPGRPMGNFLAVCFLAACADEVNRAGRNGAEFDRYAGHAVSLIGERPSDELLVLLRDRDCDPLRVHPGFAAVAGGGGRIEARTPIGPMR